MFRVVQVACIVAALSVATMFLSLAVIAWRYLPPILIHANGALTRTEGVLSKANATLVNVDKGTAVWAAASKSEAAEISGLVTDARGVLGSTDFAIQSVRKTAEAAGAEIGALHRSTDAATQLLAQGRFDLVTLNGSIAATRPLLETYTRSGNNLNTLLEDEHIRSIVRNFDGITANVDDMTFTANRLETKFAHPYLYPSKNPLKRVWQQAQPFAVAGAKVLATTF